MSTIQFFESSADPYLDNARKELLAHAENQNLIRVGITN